MSKRNAPHAAAASGSLPAAPLPEATRAVIDSLGDAIALLDRHGTIFATNRVWQQFAAENGADAATLSGLGLNYLETCRRNGAAHMADGIQAVLDGQQAIFNREYPCHSRHHQRWFRLTATPLCLPDGGALISHIDVTEHHQLAAELERHRHHLTAMVAERTRQLDEANQELRKLAQTRSDFLANMSHEIRTPLNAVLGFAQTGVRDSAGRRAQTNFRRILDSGQHLLGIINDILDFSKIEAGKLLVEKIPFLLHDAISRATTLTAERAKEKGLDFQVRLSPDLPSVVTGDPQRLGQILLNLLANAIKFTDSGSVSLSTRYENGQATFLVCDTGIGLSQEQLGRLFAAFEQADSSTTRRFGGTGLGLAISQRLTQAMGGTITAHSEPGAGSTFALSLPLPATEETPTQTVPALYAPPASAKCPLPRLGGLRILAAEDTEINRFVLEDMLAPEGVELTFAHNGQEAVDWVSQHGPAAVDLVLMDIQMPVMDGHEATRHLLRIAPTLPVIGLTARALAEERAQSLAAGMVLHLSKPVDAESLVAAILKHSPRPPQAMPAGAQTSSSRAAAPAPVPMTSPPAVIDWDKLTESFNGRQQSINKLLAMVEQGHADTPARLRALIAQQDLPALAALAHVLKGSMGHIRAQAVYELAAQTERAARDAKASALALGEALAQQMDVLLLLLKKRSSAMTPAKEKE